MPNPWVNRLGLGHSTTTHYQIPTPAAFAAVYYLETTQANLTRENMSAQSYEGLEFDLSLFIIYM